MAQGNLKPTINNFVSQNAAKGSFCRLISSTGGAGTKTAATVTAGYVSGMRYPDPLVLPGSFGAGVTGVIPTQILLHNGGSTPGGVMVAGLEVSLGSINFSTGTFTDGSAMPSRSLIGANNPIQTASMLVVAVVTTATVSSSTIAITYTNQAGTGSRTANMTIPASSAALTAFLVTPHFQTGDTGLQDITAVTRGTNTTGVITFYGIIPLATEAGAGVQDGVNEILTTPMPLISLQASDTIGLYIFSHTQITANTSGMMVFSGVADN